MAWTADLRMAPGRCPSCGKAALDAGDGWWRCPDGAYLGRPIEYRAEGDHVLYRWVDSTTAA